MKTSPRARILGVLVLVLLVLSASIAAVSVAAHPAHSARPLANCAATYVVDAALTGQLQHNNIITDAWLQLKDATDTPGYICSIQGYAEYWTSSGTQSIIGDVKVCASHFHIWCSNPLEDYALAFTATTSGTTISTTVYTVSGGGGCSGGATWSSYGAWNDPSIETTDGDIGYGQNFCP